MKLCSNVYNRCRFVCVKFYLNRSRFAVVVAKCYGAHFFGTHGNISCPPGPRQQTRSIGVRRPNGTDGRTDGRTQGSFIDPAAHCYAGSVNKWLLR